MLSVAGKGPRYAAAGCQERHPEILSSISKIQPFARPKKAVVSRQRRRQDLRPI